MANIQTTDQTMPGCENPSCHEGFSTTTGRIPYRLTNDYMFRAVFQSRPKALEGLCRSLLHLSGDDLVSVTLQNPIELGRKIENKEFIRYCSLSSQTLAVGLRKNRIQV